MTDLLEPVTEQLEQPPAGVLPDTPLPEMPGIVPPEGPYGEK